MTHPTEQKLHHGIYLRVRAWAQKTLQELGGDQSGAVGMLVLAATLIVFMMALVIYDTGNVARDNMEVQAAADTAAWSQTSIEARSMNMMAFTNVAKRVTFGMTSYYQALTLSYAELLILAVALAVACWVANFFAGGSLTTLCETLTFFAVEVAYIVFEELPDVLAFNADMNPGYFKDDMAALDSYQNYIKELTPWWSWSEGFIRGSRNGATAVSGWPVPRTLPGTIQGSGLVDTLPVVKQSDYAGVCKRTYSSPGSGNSSITDALTSDLAVHFADYLLKSCIPANNCKSKAPGTKGWERPVAVFLAGTGAVLQIEVGCLAQSSVWGSTGTPYQMGSFPSQAQWMLQSSNLAIAYRRSPGRSTDERAKYDYMSADHSAAIPFLHESTGTWSMARAEISYQYNDPSNLNSPDLWHPSWTVRMRPVALPGEWTGLGGNTNLNRAWHDILTYLVAGAALNSVTSGNLDLNASDIASDLIRIEMSTRGMDNDRIEGIGK
ncbi:MAG: Tad domain-containing protein [Myxococcota bacterium]|jgi:hypothetical protein|nr:Tad domain-containing protein [Myxococcota bacterium]MEC9439609.1 Tad domain-containing protein [Myxococcota bacterium]